MSCSLRLLSTSPAARHLLLHRAPNANRASRRLFHVQSPLLAAAAAAATPTSEAQPRPRGKSKKAIESPPKKRGRPRKDQASLGEQQDSDSSGVHLNITSVDATAAPTTSKAKKSSSSSSSSRTKKAASAVEPTPDESDIPPTKPRRATGRPPRTMFPIKPASIDYERDVRTDWRELPPAAAGSTLGPLAYIGLPPEEEWKTVFPLGNVAVKERVSIRNPHTAARLANAFIGEGNGKGQGKGKVVIEAFPGPGVLSRALLDLPKERIDKLIILEDHEPYLEKLRILQEKDPRVHIVEKPGFSWEAYQHLDDSGLLSDIHEMPWEDGVHPRLHFISHIRNTVHGEQLVAQFLRSIPERSWIFKYGRVPMNYLMSESLWQRIYAPLGVVQRCKLTVIAEATSDFHLMHPPEFLKPYDEHFHPLHRFNYFTNKQREAEGLPPLPTTTPIVKAEPSFVAASILPKAEQVIGPNMLDKWDYCLRRLFVLKSTPLKNAISHVGPGAAVLLKYIEQIDDKLDVNKVIRRMSVEEWKVVLEAFDQWPFAPEDLLINEPVARLDH